jgi:dTMP kinase
MKRAERDRAGLLLVLEGLDGSGKTTQAVRLEQRLRDSGIEVVRSREPTDGPIGRSLRGGSGSPVLSPEEELAAFEADRRSHVEQRIAPALAAGKVVVLDRYYFSSAAYQGARGLDPEAILVANERFAPAPDLVLLLTLSLEEALRRIAGRGDERSRFERRQFLERCGRIFDRIDRPYLVRIDAARPENEVHQAIVAAVAPLVLERHGRRLRAEPAG